MNVNRRRPSRKNLSPTLGIPIVPRDRPLYYEGPIQSFGSPLPPLSSSWWSRNWWIVMLSCLGGGFFLALILAASQSDLPITSPASSPHQLPSSYGIRTADNTYLENPSETPPHWPAEITYSELQAVPSITDDQIARGSAIAFHAKTPVPQSQIPVGLKAFLDAMVAATTDAGVLKLAGFCDPAGIAACAYRTSRVRDICHTDANLAAGESWALAGYQADLLRPGSRLGVTRYEVKGIRKAFSVQTGQAHAYREVFVRFTYEDGSQDRFWLLMRQDTKPWQCCDHVNLDMGWRGSELSTRFLLDVDQWEIDRIHLRFETLIDAHIKVAECDPEAAIRLAEPVDPTQTILESYRHAVLGRAYLDMGQMTRALHHFNLAQDLRPSYRYVSIYKAQACNGLGLYDRALEHLDEYADALGPCQDVEFLRGEAYQALGSPPKAADAYRRAMEHRPWLMPLLGFGQVVEADRAGEVGRYYLKLDAPTESFYALANAYMDAGADHSLSALLDAHRRIKPDDQALPFYRAQVLRIQGELPGAIELLRETLPSITNAELRPIYEREVVLMHLADDQPLKGYAWAPDKLDAFATLAAELVGLGDDERLGELIRAHRANHPDDPVLATYTGEWHLMRDEPAKALPYYRAAFKASTDDPAQAELRRVNLVYCLHVLDRRREAYRTVGPKADTFRQLAMLLNSEGDRDGLAELARMRLADAPTNGEALYWLGEALYQQGEIDQAHDALQAACRHIDEDHPYQLSIADKLIRCLIRQRRFDQAESLARDYREKHRDPYYELLLATRRDKQPATALRLARKLERNGYLLHRLMEDPDMAVGLQRPAMQPLRRLCEQSQTTPAP